MKYHLVLLCFTIISLTFINVVFSEDVKLSYGENLSENGVFFVKSSFKLICNSSDSNVKFLWSMGDSAVDSTKDKHYEIVQKGSTSTLTVKEATDQNAGNYTCSVIKNNATVASTDIIVKSKIYVRVASKNINVVEGETLTIHCEVVGRPYPKLSWSFENSSGVSLPLSYFGDRVQIKDAKDLPQAIFELKKVEMADRGEYTCTGIDTFNNNTEVNATCIVRIKDKYAALWPFLGICAEVFVLCAIIFIYEKKRNKTELEESDTDQSPDQKNTPDHGKESNLRHRQ